MRRILAAIGLLLILAATWIGCQDRRKDQIPTQIQRLPKEQPHQAGDQSPD